MPNYKNAFKCKKCPETASEKGCPVWWEIIVTNEVTKEKKVEKGCGFQLQPQMLVLTAKQAMHTTYAAYDMRNKVVKNIGKVITAIKEKLKIELPDELTEFEELKLIEEKREDGIS